MTVVLHLDVPESPIDLIITDISYSTITLQWKAGFDGGLMQSFSILVNNLLWIETNETYVILTSKLLKYLKINFKEILFRSSTFGIL